jgi:flagellar protein FliS
MTTVIDRGASTYAKLDMETGVASATPQMLIVMLYDGALKAIASARVELLRKDYAAKGRQLSKAIGIIDEGLKLSLDLEAGGEIAANLAALYEYMTRQLMLANLHNDTIKLDEISGLLRELKGAWESLVNVQAAARAEASAQPPRTRASASYGKA